MPNNHTTVNAQYSGPLTLNARGIRSALSSILKRDEHNNDITGSAMSLDDLGNVLNYLECIVMSDDIFLDGTLPPKDITLTQSMIDDSDRMFQWYSEKNKPNTSFIYVEKEEELAQLCKEAAEQSSELIRDLDIDNIQKIVSRPVKDKDIEPFESCFLYKMSGDERDELGNKITKGILEHKTFRGSKCVIGLLTAECEDIDLYDLVHNWFKKYKNNPEVKACLISALINRFRTNYINALSSVKDAAYLADPSIESLKTQQTQLLWKYLLRQIPIEKNEQFVNMRHDETFKKKYLSFPIGVAVLLNTKENDPNALIETAIKIRKESFNKLSVKESPNTRFLNYEEDDMLRLQDDLFGKLHKKARYADNNTGNWFYKFTHFSIPAIIGAGVLGTTANIAAESYTDSEMVNGVVTTLTSILAERGITTGLKKLYGKTSDIKIYSDTIRNWNSFYEDAWLKEKDGMILLSDRVEKVFNRQLSEN